MIIIMIPINYGHDDYQVVGIRYELYHDFRRYF